MIFVRSVTVEPDGVVVEYAQEEDFRENGMERATVLGVPFGTCEQELERLLEAMTSLVAAASAQFETTNVRQEELFDDDEPGLYDNPADQ